jgi:cell division protein FtsL
MSVATRVLRDLRHAEQPRPQLRAVPEPVRQRRDWLAKLFTGLATIAVCFGLFGVIGVHVMLAQGQGEVQRLQEQEEKELVRRQRLALQAAELESPSRIVAAAHDRLGLVPPTTVVPLPAASLDDPPPTTIAPAPATAPPSTAPAPTRR